MNNAELNIFIHLFLNDTQMKLLDQWSWTLLHLLMDAAKSLSKRVYQRAIYESAHFNASSLALFSHFFLIFADTMG